MVPGRVAPSTWRNSLLASGESCGCSPTPMPSHWLASALLNTTRPSSRDSTHSATGAVSSTVRLNSSLSTMSRWATSAGWITRRLYQSR